VLIQLDKWSAGGARGGCIHELLLLEAHT